jgi:hypothetical protein
MADDYCTAARINEIGFIKSQIAWYSHWTGRFSFSFLVGVAEMIGPAVVPFLPITALAGWLSATVWSTYQIAMMARWPQPFLTSMVLAELLVFVTLESTPHVVQSLYWQSGMLTYTLPLILLTIYLGVLGRVLGLRRPVEAASLPMFAAFVLTVIAGGFSEAYASMQTSGLLIGAVVCYKGAPGTLRRAALPLVIAGLAGS